jgi:serine/threonine protein kinase/tetratricopeptide (TPR) repeat protein
MTEAVAYNNGSRLARRYTLLEKLGSGGQGEVWRARDEKRRVDIALKLLSPALASNESAWAQLEREHRISSRLQHPGVLKVYPPEREGDFAVLPMELASGGDLRRLRGSNYLEIIPVLIEIAEALEHAHERGVIHRDLKPGNILFGADGRALIADFGISEIPEAALRDGKPTLSPFTASPQQLRGEPPAITDDIYGLGALAYELLSGYPPFYPRFEVRRILEEPVPDLRTPAPVPPQLLILVMRMLAKRPEDRPQSMREVIDVLDSALNDTLTFEFDRVQPSKLTPTPAPTASQSVVASPPSSRSASRPGPPSPPPPSRNASRSAPPSAPPPSPPAATPTASLESARPAATVHAQVEELIAQPAAARSFDPLPPPVAPPRRAAAPWDDLQFDVKPRLMRLEQERARRWPWVVLVVLALMAFGVFFWLPRYAPPEWTAKISGVASSITQSVDQAARARPTEPSSAQPAEPSSTPATDPNAVASVTAGDLAAPPAPMDNGAMDALRKKYAEQLAELEMRAAGVWGGADFADAKARAAESASAFDAGDSALAEQHLNEALVLLDKVERAAPQALAAQLAAGDHALAAGQPEVARQAFGLAQQIDPENEKAKAALARAGNLDGVLPLLADAQNAEAARDYARAVQSYSQALSRDPGNASAREGLSRARAALGEDTYSRSVGAGYAALGAGRLEDARAAFEKARSILPNGREAASGLASVNAALGARGFSYTRQHAASLEAEERWTEALDEYEGALKIDPSLAFAQQGKARTAARAELASALQSLIDEPDRLAAPSVRSEANALIEKAQSIDGAGPVLRSQVARLQILLPEFDKPVRLELISDNATQVAIQRVGEFGSFSRREIELKPGKYTVIGKREGFRDVRRDITVAPGNDQAQTISVSCVEPI